MRRMGSVLAGCLVLAISTLAMAQSAADKIGDFPLAKRLPVGAMVYVGWAGPNPTFDASPFGQMLRDPSVTAATSMAVTMFKSQIPQDGRPAFDSVLSGLEILGRHPVALALLELKPAAKSGQTPVVSAVFMAELGTDREAFEKALAPVLALIPPTEKTTEGDITTLKDGPAKVSFGYIGNTFVITVGDDTLQLIQGMTTDKSLMGDPAFLKVMAAVGQDTAKGKAVAKEAQFGAYVDTVRLSKAIFDLSAPPNPQGENPLATSGKYLKAFGVDKVTSLAASMRVVDDGLYCRVRIASPSPHEGVLDMIGAGPVNDADFAAIPADATSACVAKVSVSDVFAQISRAVKMLSNDDGAAFDKALADAKTATGVSIKDDIIASFADTWTAYLVIPASDTEMPNVVIYAKLKDAAKLSAAIDQLEACAAKAAASRPSSATSRPSPLKIVTVGKLQVHTFVIPDMAEILPQFAGLQPSWCVYGDNLYLGMTPQSLATAAADKPAKPLTQSPGFIKARSHIGGQPGALLYTDEARAMANFKLPDAMAASPIPQPIQTAIENLVRGLSKYMQPEIEAINIDNDGMTIETFGSMPSGRLMVVPATAMGVAVLVPAIQRARELARRAGSMANLNAIGKGIVMYTVGGSDEVPPPPDLDTLVNAGNMPEIGLISPLTGKTYAYIYLKYLPAGFSAKNRDENPVIVAFDDTTAANDSSVVPVLMSNGIVKLMDRKTFDAELEKSLKLMKEQGGKYFPPVTTSQPAAINRPTVRTALPRGQTDSMKNLSDVGKGMIMYMVAGSDDAVAPDFQALVKQGYITPEKLVSPLTGKTYAYIRIEKFPDASAIVAFDDPDAIKDGMIPVLRVDGSVAAMDRKTFDAELEKSLKLMKEHGGKYFPPAAASQPTTATSRPAQ